jgi:hypothetical protein
MNLNIKQRRLSAFQPLKSFYYFTNKFYSSQIPSERKNFIVLVIGVLMSSFAFVQSCFCAHRVPRYGRSLRRASETIRNGGPKPISEPLSLTHFRSKYTDIDPSTITVKPIKLSEPVQLHFDLEKKESSLSNLNEIKDSMTKVNLKHLLKDLPNKECREKILQLDNFKTSLPETHSNKECLEYLIKIDSSFLELYNGCKEDNPYFVTREYIETFTLPRVPKGVEISDVFPYTDLKLLESLDFSQNNITKLPVSDNDIVCNTNKIIDLLPDKKVLIGSVVTSAVTGCFINQPLSIL